MPEDLPGIGRGNTRCFRKPEYVPAEPTPDSYPHKMLGIEIEGYFGSRGYDEDDYSAQFRNRQSLAHKLTGDSGNADGGEGCWEFRTSPGDIVHAFSQLHQLYPDGTNSGCGMHVHVSFKNVGDITLLTNPEFEAYFLDSFEKWAKARELPDNHPFWDRWLGRNQYCQRNTEARKQWERNAKENVARGYWRQADYENHKHTVVGGKYQQLNFGAWQPTRQTLECRMLPMFDRQEEAESAIRHLLDTYASYLASVSPVEAKVKVPKPPGKEVPVTVYKLTTDTFKVSTDKTVVVSKYDINPSMPGTKVVPAVLISKAR